MTASHSPALFRPTAANRVEAIELVRSGITRSVPAFKKSVEASRRDCAEALSEADSSPLGIAVAAGFVFFDSVGLAVAESEGRPGHAWQSIDAACAAFNWGVEIAKHEWRLKRVAWDAPSRNERSLLPFHGLLVAGQQLALAESTARFIYNLVVGGGADSVIQEEDVLEFYRVVLRASVKGEWIDSAVLRSRLGAFAELIGTADDPAAFPRKLEAYCDFRLSRSFQYPTPDSKRPRRPSDPMSLFEDHWLALVPFELFTLADAFERALHRPLHLTCEHPLLSSALMAPPAFTFVGESELAGVLQSYGRARYGNQWAPPMAIEPLSIE